MLKLFRKFDKFTLIYEVVAIGVALYNANLNKQQLDLTKRHVVVNSKLLEQLQKINKRTDKGGA